MSDPPLSHDFAKSVPIPVRGARIHYDPSLPGFGLRVTAAGAKAFVLNYRTRAGRERRYTIGQFPALSVAAARKRAGELKTTIREGRDPLAEIAAEREAPTMANLCDRFLKEHAQKKRPSTRNDYQSLIRLAILPAWRHRKVAEISFEDVDALHRRITEHGTGKGRAAPYQANRTVAVLSKMFNLAVRWRWRTDNPTKGLERNPEAERKRYLHGEELAALLAALAERDETARAAKYPSDRAADMARMLLLTGARSGEIESACWCQFDLRRGTWTKPAALTKQKSDRSVPLSAPARKLLAELLARIGGSAAADELVFPPRPHGASQSTLKHAWRSITQRANVILFASREDQPEGKLVAELRRSLGREPSLREVQGAAGALGIKLPIGLQDLRVHDLRHSYASFLVSSGLSLPVIGALLGHTQPITTARYAHLFDDPLRQATERVGEIVSASNRSSAAPIVSAKGSA